MQILRIVEVTVIDSSNIDVTFTDTLTSNLVVSNVNIISDSAGVPDSQPLQVKVSKNILSINCQPLTPLANYFLEFKSTTTHPFISLNNQSKISEDGVSNKFLITAPLSADNPVKNYLESYFKDNIYNATDDSSLIGKYIQSLAVNMSRALFDIGQVKNENYLSFTTTDERKIRGSGPFDRLNEEGAYEIMRVGRGPSTASANNSFIFSEFPTYPVTLQRQINTESLQVDSVDDAGIFNINTLTLNLSKSPVTRMNSLIFTFTTPNPIYVYDISELGYQIKDSRYDQDFGFSYLTLDNNQIRISERALEDPNFDLNNIFKIDVVYEYKNKGIVVTADNVSVTTILDSTREVLPPITNVFNLQKAPVVNATGNIPTQAGVTFTDPNNNVVGAAHPAFIREIPFRLNALPSSPGQYSIDYANGQVYVYGADSLNDGTGPSPPLATYKYKLTFKTEQDYVFDPDLLDLVALPNGNLVNDTGTIAFKYEEAFIPDVDYKINLHQESLTERAENRLVAINVLKTKNAPITNVFRIFNETSGEIYNLNRWSEDKIYFRYDNPPRVISQTAERVTFNTVINELLFVNFTLTNISSLRIFKILLNNNTIISSTEDSLASSINTSLFLSDGIVFQKERWFNQQNTEQDNMNRLINVGEYIVDYVSGIIYVAVSNTQDFSIGTTTYKNNIIKPIFPHLISADDIYYRISPLNPKNKTFSYTSFGEGEIIPETLDKSDEEFLNGITTAPYQLYNKSVGVFSDSSFINGVTNQIKFVRSIYENSDILNSTFPINFANSSTSNGYNITVNSIIKQSFDNVKFDIDGYYVNINENIPYLSSNITFDFTITRVFDGYALWNLSGIVTPGDPVKLILPGINNPLVGDLVKIDYSFTINDLSHLIINYNKGDYFTDYTYVADEIIISYEYGDNVIDFRNSTTVPTNTQYFVSYKAGALRDALLKNFGTLVDVPELSNFDIDFNRERYREALIAALSSFIQGPTVSAIKNIGKVISHIEPEITESAFINWSLGNSLLFPESISTSGEFQLLPAKFDNGALVKSIDQEIKFPANSNIRLEEGTFENWIIPQWNGLDNDAPLTFNILKDGYTISSSEVFIGSSEYHPDITQGVFSLDKNSDNIIGSPNTNKDGVFIYYDKDVSGSFNRWFVRIIDGYTDGYGSSSSYKFKISSTGTFYDSKSIVLPKPSNLTIFTGINIINFTITSGNFIDEGITFLSDHEHYVLDLGEKDSKNRLSIFKDASGYMNFRVIDRNKASYTVSADVSSWRIGDPHHIAASWKLNTRNERDEIHLFIDGFEVPNIIKYGQKLRPYLHEKFRTVNPEEIIGLSDRDIVASVDLHTTTGSPTVTSSINFSSFNIFAGDTIFIDELGFNTLGYTIASVAGQTLTLNTVMPLTLTDARFSINRTQFTVLSDIDVSPNIAVTTIHTFITGTDGYSTSGSNKISSLLTNFVTGDVQPGYFIRVDGYDELETIYTILQVFDGYVNIDGPVSISFGASPFQIYSNTENEIPGVRALRPSYSISKDGYFNNILTISNNVFDKDLILIRTLGLNHRKVKKQYYVWSSGQENVLMTQLPPPISLDEAKITKIILPTTFIGPSNSTLMLGEFHSINLVTAPTSNSQVGRTINVTISGNNVDFSSPVQVTINGVSGFSTINETISFTDYGTLNFSNLFISTNYITVQAKPLNVLRNAVNVEAREKYSITQSESSGLAPVIRYSYHMGAGSTLYSDGYASVRDDNFLFSGLDVNNYLVIHAPIAVAGFYIITGFSEDRKSLTIQATNQSASLPLPSFTDGYYQVLNTSSYRSGLQNGFFTLEARDLPSQEYFLNNGFYEIEYLTYASMKLDPVNYQVYLGSDLHRTRHLNGIMDQVKIYSIMLTDTRIGESIPANQRSITKDFNSLKALKSDANTLMLINFNDFPFTNQAKFYIRSKIDKQHFQSSVVINENFGNSLVVLDKPIILSNDGILDNKKEGTIEFWVNPLFDTANDPSYRFYFDAFGAVIEEAVSTNSTSVKISAPASRILSVKLKAGDARVDYFAGGKLEIDTQRAIQEESVSISNSSVQVVKTILQIISVKIVGDVTETDYFTDGSVGTDQKTIYLGKLLPSSSLPLIITYQTTENKNNSLNTQVIRLNKKLPYQNTRVVVSYLPQGLQGDRISIFKDPVGYMNFAITASGTDYVVRAPTRWAQHTWHRVKASYKINGGVGQDEIKLFLDGYEWDNVFFGSNVTFGKFPWVYGSSHPGGGVFNDGYTFLETIRFKDPINNLFIGSQYTGESPIFSLMDNFRISNLSRPIYAPYGEPLDVNYSTNLSTVFPVTKDLYTTYLMDFDQMVILNDDFAILKNRETGLFDFSVNILDSFGIVNDSIKSKEALEKLIKILKPANSRVFISYTR